MIDFAYVILTYPMKIKFYHSKKQIEVKSLKDAEDKLLRMIREEKIKEILK